MEWVETTGRTIDEAKEHALDQLGVAEDDAEFEVLEEPRPGLFGRVRGQARVRARVRPTQVRPKVDRRERKKRGEGKTDEVRPASSGADVEAVEEPAAPVARSPRAPRAPKARAAAAPAATGELDTAEAPVTSDGVSSEPTPRRAPRSGAGGGGRRPRTAEAPRTPEADLDEGSTEMDVDAQQVGEEAVRFVQTLVERFGLEGTASLRRDGDDLEVAVEGADLGLLVGPRGVTLLAVQDLTRVAAQRRLGDHDTRLRVDVAGYRERRREALTRFAHQVAAEVVAEGQARLLEPMASADRKVIHDVLATYEGVVTRSEGEDPQRRVVIAPANG
jgi:spoIIIJ-associated protein